MTVTMIDIAAGAEVILAIVAAMNDTTAAVLGGIMNADAHWKDIVQPRAEDVHRPHPHARESARDLPITLLKTLTVLQWLTIIRTQTPRTQRMLIRWVLKPDTKST